MIDLAMVYRDQIVRAVLGSGPAILAKEANTTALDRMAARLADAEEALEQLRAKGYGSRGQTLTEVAHLIPATPERATRSQDTWSKA